MHFDYCENCDKRECMYTSTNAMIELLNESHYVFDGCPDKEPFEPQNPSSCTADIRLVNKYDNNAKIYLEIKSIPFAFEHSKDIGSSKSYERMVYLISEIFNIYEECGDIVKNNYTIDIEKGHIPDFDIFTFYQQYTLEPEKINKEIINFIDDFVDYIYNNKNNLTHFTFKRRDSIEINFIPSIPFSNNNIDNDNVNSSQSDLENIVLKKFIIEQNGFYFAIPAYNGKDINLKKYIELNAEPKEIIDRLVENFNKAKNSFYGINEGRYVIHELFFKYNDTTLYLFDDTTLTPFGEMLINNIVKIINENKDKVIPYNEYFDKSFLFITIDKFSYMIQLF